MCLGFKTLSVNNKIRSNINNKWLLFDADNQILGRFCSIIAKLIIGKNKIYFTPNINCGNKVIIINASKIILTGKKMKNKLYISYSGYPGGKKKSTAIELFKKNPCKLIYKSILGMLPKTSLGRKIIKNLYIFTYEKHNFYKKKMKKLNINEIY
ncbi:50S ribosomal protein L13 [Candidatus Karelsulcia muelleri CARI]|uniref:Large ribosomal subunit protein uL13 n=1 Tax=Karelsulcia muelleri (strain CARI) TaxID=706194 RepID=E0TJE4_KARMC|nr:50S ribosomal protein L13 [Candidatus Karelsulcia muelleri CARI]